jgi:polyhydroxyalkanoate synthesis regulator phasin
VIVKELFKKAALFNAELISMSAEKIKEVADDFVRTGILDDQEARRFVLDVREKLSAKEAEFGSKFQDITQQVTQQVGKFSHGVFGQNVLGSLNFLGDALRPARSNGSSSEPIDGRIDELERQLDDLRSRKDHLKNRTNGRNNKDEIAN